MSSSYMPMAARSLGLESPVEEGPRGAPKGHSQSVDGFEAVPKQSRTGHKVSFAAMPAGNGRDEKGKGQPALNGSKAGGPGEAEAEAEAIVGVAVSEIRLEVRS